MTVRLAAVALLLCAPVAAQAADDPAPTATPSDAAAQPEKPKKICRMETRTGSNMPTRVCRTREQIEADHAAANRAHDQVERGL